MTLCFGSIGMDPFIGELCCKGIILQSDHFMVIFLLLLKKFHG